MKSTGIVRELDELGRIVIPIEIRRVLRISSNDYIEIYKEGDGIILQKYQNSCILCGRRKELIEYESKYICLNCLQKLKQKTYNPVERAGVHANNRLF